ncbi:hypothetical protein BD309DRAFT_998214 [Dichomitus squalens]|uniref:Uncharacterized protein n=1 Tax=Dichomitus squalens TaxID=114155 RepID=A0A4V2K1R7_9APHY|nr:hypothetical protein BD311DRAFT_794125 [Dichomitus squalens]TBU47646.1 hypothetical protein BD309DRAFT_998214 [Dichomitus squalens]
MALHSLLVFTQLAILVAPLRGAPVPQPPVGSIADVPRVASSRPNNLDLISNPVLKLVNPMLCSTLGRQVNLPSVTDLSGSDASDLQGVVNDILPDCGQGDQSKDGGTTSGQPGRGSIGSGRGTGVGGIGNGPASPGGTNANNGASGHGQPGAYTGTSFGGYAPSDQGNVAGNSYPSSGLGFGAEPGFDSGYPQSAGSVQGFPDGVQGYPNAPQGYPTAQGSLGTNTPAPSGNGASPTAGSGDGTGATTGPGNSGSTGTGNSGTGANPSGSGGPSTPGDTGAGTSPTVAGHGGNGRGASGNGGDPSGTVQQNGSGTTGSAGGSPATQGNGASGDGGGDGDDNGSLSGTTQRNGSDGTANSSGDSGTNQRCDGVACTVIGAAAGVGELFADPEVMPSGQSSVLEDPSTLMKASNLSDCPEGDEDDACIKTSR